MAYKIQYGTRGKGAARRGRGRRLICTLVFFALFTAAAHYLVPEQLAALRQILFADLQVDALLQDLQEGTSITEAVSAFCQGIFHGE